MRSSSWRDRLEVLETRGISKMANARRKRKLELKDLLELPKETGEPAYNKARTPLGAKLRRIRRRIIESGEPLLTREQVRREVAKRRGGVR
jgi:hypothetical protein